MFPLEFSSALTHRQLDCSQARIARTNTVAWSLDAASREHHTLLDVDKPPAATYYSPIMASDRIQRQIDRLLDEAAARQDWEIVRARAQHVLTFDPENREGQAFLSAATRGLEGHQAAVDLTTVVEQPTAAVDDVQAQDSLAGGVFVGRLREMDDLQAALEDALSGRGRLVALSGEPGIGKTRTAQELAVLAEQRGALVLWGWCYEGEGAPPYWPWVQLMRAYVQQASAEQITAEMGPGAANIAEIVTEIRGKLPDLGTPPVLEQEPARFRLFDSITTFLKNAAQRQPLMLVLDDLHWADRSSLLLLEFLAREIGTSRLLLVCSYRDVEVSRRHPLSQTLGTLVREQIFHRVQLDGLTQQEVGELVEGSAGITLTLEAAEVIHKRTDGNPFFVGEVTRNVTLENFTEDPGWASIIPEGVRDAIGRRLNRLSDHCNQMLTTASVVGQEFEFRLLNSLMSDITEDQLLAAMDEAVEVQLIEELPNSVGLYQFTHALIQETLFEELSTTRRVRLHARIAEGLETLYGNDADVHAEELAYHFAEAQTLTGPEKLVRYSLMAGQQALASYAYDDALTYFEKGLAARDIALSGTDAACDEEAADLLFGLARARSNTVSGQQLVEAFAILSRAFDYYAEAGNVAQAVAAALFPIVTPSYRIPGITGLLARALTLVPADSHEAGRILCV